MRAVELRDLAALVEQKPILIVNKTAIGLGFVSVLVKRCPTNLASKPGNVYLPLEIWHIILDYAALDLETTRSTPQLYNLAQLHGLKRNKEGRHILECKIIISRSLCGKCNDASAVAFYEWYLARPDGPFDRQHTIEGRPFDIPDSAKEIAKSNMIEIPTIMLMSDIKSLYTDITVPDIISRMEGGNCSCCSEERIFSVGPLGCQNAKEVCQNFISFSVPVGNHRFSMLCPLCMGIQTAEKSLKVYGKEFNGTEKDKMTIEEYQAWCNGRFAELGYL